MTKTERNIHETVAWHYYQSFLRDNDFKLLIGESAAEHYCTILGNDHYMLAVIFQSGMGENFVVAKLGKSVSIDNVFAQKNGWNLIGHIWPEAFDSYRKGLEKYKYPDRPSAGAKAELKLQILYELDRKIRSKEVEL